MNLTISKTQLDIHGWKFLQEIYPNTIQEIIDWCFSSRKIIKNFPYTVEDLIDEIQYFDRNLYDYFDSLKINISVFKNNKKFLCKVNTQTVSLNEIYFFNERSFADICGFIHGMNIREYQLSVIKIKDISENNIMPYKGCMAKVIDRLMFYDGSNWIEIKQ